MVLPATRATIGGCAGAMAVCNRRDVLRARDMGLCAGAMELRAIAMGLRAVAMGLRAIAVCMVTVRAPSIPFVV